VEKQLRIYIFKNHTTSYQELAASFCKCPNISTYLLSYIWYLEYPGTSAYRTNLVLM